MKKVKYFFKHYYRDILIILFIGLSLYLTFFYFNYAGVRIKESLYDIYTTLIYYGCSLFDIDYGNVSVIEYTKAPFRVPFNLPQTWEEFKEVFSNYWSLFFSKEIFNKYLYVLLDIL